MMALPANTRIWIAAGVTDLRRGFTGLSALVETKLEQKPMLLEGIDWRRPERTWDPQLSV